MKMISKIAKVALGLVLVGSSVFAQSLDDAKKAIDAEQYQKAKSMLKNLTVTQPTVGDNFFYLGWVYLIQEYPDSAKDAFTRGTLANPKLGLNYVGLGAVAHLQNDAATTTADFGKAIEFSKKDSRIYVYMAKGYLLLPPGVKTVSPNDYTAAVGVLNKGKLINPKDAEISLELGNAARSQSNSTDAYTNYNDALTLNPKLLTAIVAQGVSLERAQNFEDAEEEFKKAIAIDANFGPAYREWAETDLYWSQTVRNSNGPVASAKVKEAVDHYKQYLSLTDNSTETLLRYALFLYNAADYETLESVAATLAKSANSNALVYRYIGYSSFHNKDYPAGVAAMNTWFAKAAPERIIPSDYLMLGRLQVATGDTVKGVANLKKYADIDTTKIEEIYGDIATMYREKKNYPELVKTYQEEISKIHGRPMLTQHLSIGTYTYSIFRTQAIAARKNPSIKADSSLLIVADSALSYVQQRNPNPVYQTARIRAEIADEKDADYAHLKGLSLPYWEQVIKLITAKDSTKWDRYEKSALSEAYAAEGNFALYHEPKDEAKAEEWYTKDRALNPTEYFQDLYFKNKAAAEANAAAIKAAEEKKNAKKGAGTTNKPQQQKE